MSFLELPPKGESFSNDGSSATFCFDYLRVRLMGLIVFKDLVDFDCPKFVGLFENFYLEFLIGLCLFVIKSCFSFSKDF